LIDAIVRFAETLDDEDRKLLQDVLVERGRPRRQAALRLRLENRPRSSPRPPEE
jgi:hypothetical protein